MDNGPTTIERGYHQILKANLSKLIDEIQPDDICDDLFSAGILSEDEYEFVCDEQKKSLKARNRKLLYSTLQSLKGKPEHFQTFLRALEESKSEVALRWARKLRDDAKQIAGTQSDDGEIPNIQELRNELSVLRKGIYRSDELVEAKYDVMKEAIMSFVKNCHEASIPKARVSKQLHKLCYEEMLIPSKLYAWVFALLETVNRSSSGPTDPATLEEAGAHSSLEKKLFSRAIVSNCLLLCRMVALSDSHKKFLSKCPHDFDEVSVSVHSRDFELERYVIAKREADKELYITFLSEPDLNSWKKYGTFSEGITVQTDRIPVRFFVEQIQDNYTIIFTGFSFGGLLALSVYTSVWNQTCLSISNLSQNTSCITFGSPIVPLESVVQTMERIPEMRENSHIFLLKEDFIPRLLRFDRITNKGAQALVEKEKFPGNFGEVIVNQLLKYMNAVETNEDIDSHVSTLKTILSDDHLSKLQDTKLCGICHFVYSDASGLQMTQLAPSSAQDVLKIPISSELDQIPKASNMIKEHLLSKYSQSLEKTFISSKTNGAAETSAPTKVVSILKPDVSSITFYRHGDEIALVLQGQNLWFCSKINIKGKNGSRFIDTLGADATSRSVHFNYTPKDENDLLIERNVKAVDIILYSHFAGSIEKRKISAKCNGEYRISYRQRQLAACTPGQVLTLSFLSALMECTTSNVVSRRYTTICQFLEEAVRIVPIESIFHSIAIAPDHIAWKCTEAFMTTKVSIPHSLQLTSGLENACARLTYGLQPGLFETLQRQTIQIVTQMNPPIQLPPVVQIGVTLSTNTSSRSFSEVVKGTSTEVLPAHAGYHDRNAMLAKMARLRDQARVLCEKRSKAGTLRVISDLNVEKLFTMELDRNDSKLKSPIEVLRLARQRLEHLRLEEESRAFPHLADAKSSFNEEMLSTIEDISNNEMFICLLLLGAFMEQQIRIPLVDSPLETAHILQTTEAPPAVGVWALFSLNMIDFQKMYASGKKGKAMVVKVEKYIKGILAKSTHQKPYQPSHQLEDFYAGKLQFLMQCLNDTVSCNSNYISYSLETQLAELCQHRNIKPTTRVATLVDNWDSYFKGNLLHHILQSFRPLIARWIIWCLNIHRLREELASHTTVGIVGLSNSGKSSLVRTLFKQKVTVGPTSTQRTTVSFLYNLDGTVDGLSVIDFPGVDDEDQNTRVFSQVLFRILQLVVFVLDFKSLETEAAIKWLQVLKAFGIPVLICLTHADKLYANTCIGSEGRECSKDYARRLIQQELEKAREKLKLLPNWQVGYYSFCQDPDSSLNCEEGRHTLADVGILSCKDVGIWLEKELRDYMKEEGIAERLKRFLSSDNDESVSVNEPQVNLMEMFASDVPSADGLNWLGETKIDVTREGRTFIWDGYGLKVTIPPDAISDDSCSIHVKVISTGQYELPENTTLCSSLYWFYSPRKFLKKVLVGIQHCSSHKAVDQNLLSFVNGRCNQGIPYRCTRTQGGSFSRNDRMGLISLKSFCLLGIVSSCLIQSPPLSPSQAKVYPMLCVAKVFGKCSDQGVCTFKIVFMKDLKSYNLAICDSYRKDGWIQDMEQKFELFESFISIDLESLLGLDGWKCTIKNGQKIRRKVIEHSQPNDDMNSPCSTMEFRWSKEGKPHHIQCPLVIKGAIDSPKLTLTLPIPVNLPITQADEIAIDKFTDSTYSSYSLEACNAVKLLRDAGFGFRTCLYGLLVELHVETDFKQRLLDQAWNRDGYEFSAEQAIDWWISNKEHSWDLFIDIIRKCEQNTATKIKEMLLSICAS